MFFKRHEGVTAALKLEVTTEEVQHVEVSEAIFQNGTFQELPSIKKWNIEKATLVSPTYQKGNVDAIKRVCQGRFYLKDHVTKKLKEVNIPNWIPKTPERLTLEQAQEFIAEVHKAHSGTKGYRIAIRDFFLSRDHITLKTTEVSGMMPPIGKWKHVFVPRETLDKIFAHVKERNPLAYAADFTMFKTGFRSTATLTEFQHRKLRQEDGVNVIAVTDKGFHRTGRQTFDKIITEDLLAVLNECWGRQVDNAFFGLDETELRNLNKDAYRLFLTGEALDLGLSEPNHFWRHMFGAHMLRATNWNYTAVAELGSWSNEDMLKKVYGAPPTQMLRKLGIEYIPKI
jgi:integrase